MAEDFPSGLAESPVPGNTGQIASYEMVEELGRGGMAVVYRARDVRLGRWVALKVLGEDLARDEAFRRRFIRESRAAAAVDHPNIVPIFDAGEANGVLFIAMRYVGGQDVHSLLNRTGPLPSARATGIVAQVASALDAAHACGLVHRDVKPANMLLDGLAEDGSEDHVYLSDFGISKTSQSTTNLTLTGQVLGTLNYLAPEQIEGRGVDGRADAYSLACAAFEMLAGVPPFRREQSLAVMWAQLSAAPPPLTSMRGDLPPAVDQVMARGLAKPPEDRYPSCRAFAAALQEACGVSAGELAAPARAAQGLVPPPPGGLDPAATDPGGSRLAAPDQAASPIAAGGQTTPAGPAVPASPAVPVSPGVPISPAVGFPAPPRPAEPTSADPPRLASSASAGAAGLARPAGADPSRPASWADAESSRPVSWADAGSSRPVSWADAEPSRPAPPASPGPFQMGPPASAGGSGLRPAPPTRPPGPPSRQGPRGRRRGLAVLATSVLVLAVLAVGLALWKEGFLTDHRTAGGGGSANSSPTVGAAAATVSPPTVVKRYYAAISRRAYLRAWQLGGDHTTSSFASFKAGFSDTVRDVVVITGWQGYTVTADFKAVHKNGTVSSYTGTYVVGNGVITSFSVHQVG
ncbi:MAG TPA: protein kinase [Streptosporangiaceae bacterium]|nr:protein kinase [Streptosporangiaceae bacterium]